ncbi:precorrin-4 C(11)-methyltransferase [Caldiplasma sukawensis]
MFDRSKVYIMGAGPGDPGLLTVKGKELLESADIVVYAGSLVNPEILKICKKDAIIHDSSGLNRDQVFNISMKALSEGKLFVRVHSGDPHIYGALKEQIQMYQEAGVNVEVIPGVSVLTSAAASLGTELTIDGISQSIIIARGSRRIPVDQRDSIKSLAKNGSTMVIFAAIHMIDSVVKDLMDGGYSENTPVGIVYHSTWPDEKRIIGTLKDIVKKVKEERIYRTALIIVGDVVNPSKVNYSKLYDPSYTHSFRRGNNVQ